MNLKTRNYFESLFMDFESFYNKYYEIDDSVSIIDNFSDEILAAEYISEMREALYEALMMLNEMQ